jgi:Zn-dependent protease with chaperone function
MDFFELQDNARRRTKWLVAWFVLAVLGIIAAIHTAFCLVFGEPLDNLHLLGLTALGVTAAVALGSLVKIIQLAQGGKAVAEMLGGTPVPPSPSSPAERRLRNVVEEMAIASGVPVPSLYLLDDDAINAFAAGWSPSDAAIGVTRGCIDRLDRDELQSVIGHEFSHILNGDMRLNIRLIGVLNGILFLAIIGGVLLRSSIYAPRSRRSSDSKGAGSLILLLIAGGLILLVVGYIGVFFGKLIKAAVSRQREFLADAAAVQFTRNPRGLAGALHKIETHSSRLATPRAAEASHMFFGDGLAKSWISLFATHPPIPERIAAIMPNFDPSSPPPPPEPPTPQPPARRSPTPPPLPAMPGLLAAAAILDAIPQPALDAAHDPSDAMALAYALLLPSADDHALSLVDPAHRDRTATLHAATANLPSARKFALLDLAIPALRTMTPESHAAFSSTIRRLVEADGQIHLFEYTLQKSLLRHLDATFSKPARGRIAHRSLTPLLPDLNTVLSALALASSPDPADAATPFEHAVRRLAATGFPMALEPSIDLDRFDKALDRLATASHPVKKSILEACEAAVLHDDHTTDAEYELLRAVADVLDCPMPPVEHHAA